MVGMIQMLVNLYLELLEDISLFFSQSYEKMELKNK